MFFLLSNAILPRYFQENTIILSATHFKVALVGVEDVRFFSVEDPLHLQGQSADGRLEIRLFCVHHQPHAVLHSVLETNTHTFSYEKPFSCNSALQ